MSLTILLITIATGSTGDGAATEDRFTPAIVNAARETLGAETRIVSRSVAEFPTDADAIAIGQRVHADAVVEVAWTQPDNLHATIHMERTSTGRWLDREIGFRANDDPVERSRTVAFAVASMLPERFAQTTAPEPPRAEAPAPLRSDRREHERSPESTTVEHRSPRPNAISGSAITVFGVGDYGGSVGGSLDFRHAVTRTLAFRIAVAARAGQAPPARAVTRFFYGAFGLAWNPLVTNDGAFTAGLRLDAIAMLADFRRFSADGTQATDKLKWMPGADLLVEAAWFFTPGAAIFGGGGAEAVFGTTDVIVGGQRTATFEPVHPVVELGLHAAF
jgi:hypothetical protein